MKRIIRKKQKKMKKIFFKRKNVKKTRGKKLMQKGGHLKIGG
jgi:hypothetical protein